MTHDEYIWSYADEGKEVEEAPTICTEANKSIEKALEILDRIPTWELDTIRPRTADKLESLIDELYGIDFEEE